MDGLAISNDGRVRRDGMSPLDFRVMFSLKLVGESINLVVCVLTVLYSLFLKPCFCAATAAAKGWRSTRSRSDCLSSYPPLGPRTFCGDVPHAQKCDAFSSVRFTRPSYVLCAGFVFIPMHLHDKYCSLHLFMKQRARLLLTPSQLA